ncbi:MAG: CBS domain-containing protein [Acholeplasmatales bacterium]|jgi:predicted transcriptional regulator|nr:CBS domain-containing protein [Acholeplasmatales bacterium]
MNILMLLIPSMEVKHLLNTSTLRQTIEVFDDTGYTALPIINSESEYINTIAEGDVLRYLKRNMNLNMASTEKINLKDIVIKRPVKAISVFEDIDNLLELVLEQNFIPVVDALNHFIGIVTRKRIIKYLMDNNK